MLVWPLHIEVIYRRSCFDAKERVITHGELLELAGLGHLLLKWRWEKHCRGLALVLSDSYVGQLRYRNIANQVLLV